MPRMMFVAENHIYTEKHLLVPKHYSLVPWTSSD